ncbi:hypothetical protein T01_4694 [Trichinella spiralis]|uniref:Uncharacterized protein n=1 Tax=Trichinella spiralis TaxID=6334 RepID=A0A0V1AJJ1_TRISP|nr:hypothetical protein T01_4694 [Trichinella spiralis]
MFYFQRQWRRPHVRTPLMVDVLVRVSPVPRRACNGRGTFANNGATALRLIKFIQKIAKIIFVNDKVKYFYFHAAVQRALYVF